VTSRRARAGGSVDAVLPCQRLQLQLRLTQRPVGAGRNRIFAPPACDGKRIAGGGRQRRVARDRRDRRPGRMSPHKRIATQSPWPGSQSITRGSRGLFPSLTCGWGWAGVPALGRHGGATSRMAAHASRERQRWRLSPFGRPFGSRGGSNPALAYCATLALDRLTGSKPTAGPTISPETHRDNAGEFLVPQEFNNPPNGLRVTPTRRASRSPRPVAMIPCLNDALQLFMDISDEEGNRLFIAVPFLCTIVLVRSLFSRSSSM